MRTAIINMEKIIIKLSSLDNVSTGWLALSFLEIERVYFKSEGLDPSFNLIDRSRLYDTDLDLPKSSRKQEGKKERKDKLPNSFLQDSLGKSKTDLSQNR